MVRLDVVKIRRIEASMAEKHKSLKSLYGAVAELISQMSMEGSHREIWRELDKQYESMEMDLYLLERFRDGLQQILSIYIGCEEGNAEYAEEMQLDSSAGSFGLVDIPEEILRLLG